MRIFINDIPVYILSRENVNFERAYGLIVREYETIIPDAMIDDVLILNVSNEQIDRLLKLMTNRKFKKVNSITISSPDNKPLIKYLKEKFKVIEAGGGIVEKEDKLLLIYRKKRWDIPKGKLDEGETIEECAEREVCEETGVNVKIKNKVVEVWHTYISNKKYILKKTHWYSMDCLDDSNLYPQKEEGIEKAEWVTMEEARIRLRDSYRSIRYVLQEYTKIL